MLRPEFIRRKLRLIGEDLELLARYKDETLESLTGDEITMAVVERLLERIVVRAIDINEHLISELASAEDRTTRLTYRDTFLMLSDLGVYPREFAATIAKSAGLRNILVHDYNDVDRSIVHGAIGTCLRDYYAYIEHVEGFLQRHSG